MPTVSDISFECPHCHGPLMAEASHVGMTCDCPHCYAQFQVPDGSSVNKDKFVEPQGLRRVLKQVRDQEWEMLRRKLRAAKAHSAEVEAELHRVQAVLAERSSIPKISDEKLAESDILRKQLAELSDQFTQANQAFIAGRKQQDTVIDHLRRELESARSETAAFKKKNDELARLVQTARDEISRAKEEKGNELTEEVERLRAELAETQSKLEVEQAKVLVMEAAGVSAEFPVNAEQGADTGSEVVIQELQAQVADLRKTNDSLRAARDKVHAELVALKEQAAMEKDEDLELQMALGNLEEGMKGVLELITTRRSSRAGKA